MSQICHFIHHSLSDIRYSLFILRIIAPPKNYPLKNNFIRFLLRSSVFSLLLISFSASAQTGSVRGVVYLKKDGQPLSQINVELKGTKYSGVSDNNGIYSIVNVPVGNYTLFCTSIGYDTTELTVVVKEGIISQNFFMTEVAYTFGSTDVNANADVKTHTPHVSVTTITIKDMNRIPSIGGQAELAQYLQVIPGIVFTGDQGGELYIRGGSPIQTKMLLDGMTIYNPFHSIGLFSVFETDIIKTVDVYTGGFNASYGGRISAVVDVKTREGNKKQFGGKINMNPFTSKILLEGPLKKLSKDGSSISYILTSKASYLDRSSKVLYSYVNKEGLPFNFLDVYGKVSMNSGGGSKLSLFGFNFNDKATFQQVSEFGWNSYGGGANFVLVPSASKAIIEGTISYSNYDMSLKEADDKPRVSGINGLEVNMNFDYFIPNGEVKYGFNFGGYKTTFKFYNAVDLKIENNQNSTELSGFVTYRKIINKKLILEPGLHLHYYATLPAFSPEPRFSMKYNVNKWLRVKMATGMFSQNFISTKNDLDVVNLFTGFLTAPDGQLTDIKGNRVNSNLQTAWHMVVGVEIDLSKKLELTVEPYYKDFTQLINLNRSKLLPTDPDFQIETGDAYGIDLLLKYDYKNLYVYTGYSYSFTHRNNGEQIYPPHFDRRHNANFVVSYEWGKNKSWMADLRWNLGSGFPFTQTQGFFEDLNFLNGTQPDINYDYTTANGQLGILYDSKLNGGRLPYYHRLDASINKKYYFSEKVFLDCSASIINVYNRENIFYFDRIRFSRVNQLPILPTIGASLTF